MVLILPKYNPNLEKDFDIAASDLQVAEELDRQIWTEGGEDFPEKTPQERIDRLGYAVKAKVMTETLWKATKYLISWRVIVLVVTRIMIKKFETVDTAADNTPVLDAYRETQGESTIPAFLATQVGKFEKFVTIVNKTMPLEYRTRGIMDWIWTDYR